MDMGTSRNTDVETGELVPNKVENRIHYRDCFVDFADVLSHPVFEGRLQTPHITIAIPTFNRTDLLAETVRSALAQKHDRPFEVVVVDNDPAGSADALLERVPEARTANFRYLINAENIGMFGNWNRCIEVARGEWMTILNDDDLLDPDYLARMMSAINANPAVDGIVCRKRYLDQRPDGGDHENRGIARVASRAWLDVRFGGRQVRRIGFNKLFWGALLGNSAGFLFHPADARRIGGFYPEDFPSADHWFFIRFAQYFSLWQHRAITASIRIATNESAKPSTLRAFMRDFYAMQRALAGVEVPRWWGRLSPLMVARHRVQIHDFWHQEISREEVEQQLGLRLTRDRPWLLWTIRALLRGF